MLDVTREVTRVGNYYRVKLTLKNTGNTGRRTWINWTDTLTGFQAVRKAFGSTYTVNTAYNHALRETTSRSI